MSPMRGWTIARPRLATKSQSTGISTSTSRRVRSTRSRRTSRSLKARLTELLEGLKCMTTVPCQKIQQAYGTLPPGSRSLNHSCKFFANVRLQQRRQNH